ncbi:DUF1918 domain-containing protein, partial [Mycobacterium tuberculosis]|uniref:DUF1918 domain-containing protein n=1 Tax=Mycobacterium tuberculosis TaxID=1773 RepID=UPI003C6E6C68
MLPGAPLAPPAPRGLILAVRSSAGSPPSVVRWLAPAPVAPVLPGPAAVVVPAAAPPAAAARAPPRFGAV